MKQQHFVKPTAVLTLALAALAEPALAVTNITKCQTITQPGSYRLANNLTGTGTCLTIKANQVSLDLNGHVLSGNGGPIIITVYYFTGVRNCPSWISGRHLFD